MQQFVFIFRQGTRKLSSEELHQRDGEIRAWATQLIQEGYTFDPRVLSQESYRIPAEDSSAERPIINLLFLTAKDFDDAVRIAKTHPGAHYGTTIEVRAWKPPSHPATQTR